jgi:hypothetical protein
MSTVLPLIEVIRVRPDAPSPKLNYDGSLDVFARLPIDPPVLYRAKDEERYYKTGLAFILPFGIHASVRIHPRLATEAFIVSNDPVLTHETQGELQVCIGSTLTKVRRGRPWKGTERLIQMGQPILRIMPYYAVQAEYKIPEQVPEAPKIKAYSRYGMRGKIKREKAKAAQQKPVEETQQRLYPEPEAEIGAASTGETLVPRDESLPLAQAFEREVERECP